MGLQDRETAPVGPGRCDFCGGRLAAGRTKLEIRRADKLSVVRNVPALVCEQCGEGYLSPQTSRAIDAALLSENPPPRRTVEVDEYDAESIMFGTRS